MISDLVPLLLPETVIRVWTSPELLSWGLRFSLPTLFILLCHEMGHWLACRRHRLPATPPYFLPAPIGLGTFGAFIRIRGAIRSRRELLEVGVSGPLAGFAALLPFALLGVVLSEPVALPATSDSALSALRLFLPGESLLVKGLSVWWHGPLDAGQMLNPHPFLIAAWVGIFATTLNLLPLAQLDGGHVLYAALGRLQHRLAWPLWIALAALGFLWMGWWLWCAVVLIMGPRHPPLFDERTPLSARDRGLVLAAALLLLLCFMPVPIREVGLATG
ncbi:MAG: site-2 protease family protein [Thermoanaerobaculia bacterium]|nr:MAG: site-2 protease family protein [Thermoanaerobaculia bacterium]